MKIVKETNKHLICFCENHEDKGTPNFKIQKTATETHPIGFGYCYVCGYKKKFTEEWVKNISKKKTVCRKPRPVNWDKLANTYMMSDVTERKSLKLMKEWKVNCLGKYGIGWTGAEFSVPMYNEDEEIIGIQLRTDTSKWCVDGSQLGLFLPLSFINQQVVVCEGMSDAAVATELGYYGIGLPCANFGHELVRKYLQNKKIRSCKIVADNDEAGYKSATKLNMLLTSEGIKSSVLVLHGSNDLKEFYLSKGKENTKKLLEM